MDKVPENEYKFTPEVRARFLEELAATGRMYHAAAAAGISATYVYQRRKIDPVLEAEIEEAMHRYRDLIQAEIHRRAIEGVVEHKYSQGEPVLEPELDEDGKPVFEDVVDPATGEPMLDKLGRPVRRLRYKGHAFVRHYSDQLLLAHARRHIPEYNERKSVDMKVTGLGELLAEIKGSTGLPAEEERNE